MKRKRKGQGAASSFPKRSKVEQNEQYEQKHPSMTCAVLPLYYARVWTLREYLLSKLNGSSKVRRRLLTQYGLCNDSEDDQDVCRLLDEVVVGTLSTVDKGELSQDQELSIFSQQINESTGGSSSSSSKHKSSQAEVGYSVHLIFCL